LEKNVPEAALTFKCLGHTKRDDGLIGRYNLQVTDTRSGKTATISVEPKHLASARSMKTILLDRCMVYSVTQKAHDQMLLEMFAQANDRAEIEDSR
jgi:hypothetical protein